MAVVGLLGNRAAQWQTVALDMVSIRESCVAIER
jgi:hypothetical protein